jgi:hypothetical protein
MVEIPQIEEVRMHKVIFRKACERGVLYELRPANLGLFASGQFTPCNGLINYTLEHVREENFVENIN